MKNTDSTLPYKPAYVQLPTPTPNRQQILDCAQMFKRSDGCLELRVIGKKNGSYAEKTNFVGFYDNADAFLRDALAHNGTRSVYIGLNPRKPTLLHAQPANRLVAAAEGAKDGDVPIRFWFPIDIDTKRESIRVAASEAEIEAALPVFEAVGSELASRGIHPVSADSGNGRHLLVATIPYPPSDERDGPKGSVALLLRWFARKFNSPYADVDVGVFNLSRVWKLYGTVSVKGGNTAERPWRTARFQAQAGDFTPVDILAVYAAEIEEQRTFEAAAEPKSSGPAPGTGNLGTLDVVSLFQKQDLYIGPMSGGKFSVRCPWSGDHTSGTDGDGSTVIYERSEGRPPGFKCLHSHCVTRTLRDVAEKLGPEAVDPYCSEKKRARKSTGSFDFVTLKALLSRPDEEYAWTVDGMLIAGGSSIQAGKPKTGKTTLARQLALAVSRGEPFLGRSTKRGPVLYLAVEEKAEEVKRHFREMGANGDEQIHIHASSSPDDAVALLLPIVDQIKPSLVIFDTLFRIIRVGDSNDYAVVTSALEPMQELARATGAHVMCVHHMGKAEREGGDGILGSTAILGAFDTAVLLTRKNEDRTIKTIQRYGKDLEETALTFDENTRTSVLGSSRKDTDADKLGREIVSLFSPGREPMTEKEIGEEIGGNRFNRLAALRQLHLKGRLIRSGTGRPGNPYRFSLNPNGASEAGALY